jgi:hypothetical protein
MSATVTAMPVTATMHNCPAINRDPRDPDGIMVELQGKVHAASMSPHIMECAKENVAELQTT